MSFKKIDFVFEIGDTVNSKTQHLDASKKVGFDLRVNSDFFTFLTPHCASRYLRRG